jgi:hypothetical protein
MHPIEAKINDQLSRPPQLPRGVLRQLNRNAKAKYYASGQHADPDKLTGFDQVRAAAAAAKRERKQLKRLDDAYQMELGSRASAERLSGALVY